MIATVLLIFIIRLVASRPQSHGQNGDVKSGCGKLVALPGITSYRFNLQSSGVSRDYSYHLPANYDPNRPYPVVIGFHGSSSIGLFFELDTKLSSNRYSSDKIMVYPNGLGGSWAGPSYHNRSTVQEDILFVRDVIEDMKGKFCIDENRIFATGMSNGGGFVDTLACDPLGSTLFRAFAAHSGAFYTDVNGPNNGCAPSNVVPIMEIHGTADKTVNYNGGQGEGGVEPPIPDWLEWWAQRNDCSDKREETTFNGVVHHYTWTCKGVVGLLQHYKVEGLGHAWADVEPNLSQISVPQLPTVIRASEIFIDFFDSM